MSVFDKIIKTRPKAPRITIYGKSGIGKSTLAAQFPDPVFILTEDTGLTDIAAFPVADSFEEVWGNVKGLLAEPELPYRTVVIDSISKLDALIVKYILDAEPPNKSGKSVTLNSACGGYGAGSLKAQSLHQAFKALMDKFQEKGIAVVYVSHVAITKMKAPDADDYDIYSIVMNGEKSREPYIHDVDAVLLCRLQTFTTENEAGRILVKSGSDRVIVSCAHDSHVSKARFPMPPEMPMSFDELSKYIPFYNNEVK